MGDTWTAGALIDWTAQYFAKQGITEASLDAEVLLAAVLGCPRLNLHIRRDEIIPEDKLKKYKAYVIERQKRKPVAYILGEKEFMGLRFFVNEHVLIPRPETELLVEAAAKIVASGHNGSAADICTGSGCIAVSLAKLSEIGKVYACDISVEALKVAQENIDLHGAGRKVFIEHGDLLAAIAGAVRQGELDIIVSNPPYVAGEELSSLEPELSYEPRLALDGGRDGLDYYRRIARDGRQYLKPGGYLLLELSAEKSSAIREIVANEGFSVRETVKDYAGLDRVLVASTLLT